MHVKKRVQLDMRGTVLQKITINSIILLPCDKVTSKQDGQCSEQQHIKKRKKTKWRLRGENHGNTKTLACCNQKRKRDRFPRRHTN